MEVSQVEKLRNKVKQNINANKLLKTHRIVVGLSGGPDSVCLLHVLKSLSKDLNLELFPAHLNHMLRAEEADGDEQFCKEFCKALELPLTVWHKDIKSMAASSKTSIEEAAREARYSLFREYATSLGGALIAVAHNMNDQAETVMMRIIRGTGLDGLKGMGFYSNGIIRPLLSVPRAQIEEYNKEAGLVPRIDSTNLVADYTRNKIRLELLPDIKKLFDIDTVESLYRLSRTCNEDAELIGIFIDKEYSNCLLQKDDAYIKLSIDRLSSVPEQAMGRVIRRALVDFSQSLKGIERIHIEQVKKLIIHGRSGSIVQLPAQIRIYRDYSFIKIFREYTESKIIKADSRFLIDHPGEYLLSDNQKVNVEFMTYEEYENKAVKPSQRALTQYFDAEAFQNSIVIRSRQAGDVFFPYGSSGTRKLKEFLIDEKVSREYRDQLLLLADGKEIIWIAGMRTNEKYKVNDKTVKVVKIEVILKPKV